MLKRMSALVALAVSFAVVPPAAHAEKVFALVFRANRSGYVDVKFPDGLTLDPHFGDMRMRKGRVAGFWAERLGEIWSTTSDNFGFIQVGTENPVATAAIEERIDPTVGSDGEYAPGTYRFHIVADAPFELVFPVWTGIAKSMLLTPKKYVAAPRLVAGTPTVTGSTAWEAHEQITVGTARTSALSASVVGWNFVGYHYDLHCFAKSGQPCVPSDLQPDAQAGISTIDGQHGTAKLLAGPGSLTPGTWDVVQRGIVAPGTDFTSFHAYALVFPTP